MLEPYHMVVVNALLSLMLLFGVGFYSFIFPKKKISLLILLLLISILPIVSIARKGDYESGDFNIHVYRNIAFYTALSEGQIKPTWARDLNATYGYPTFLIEGPLGDYIPALFHFLGFSFIDSFKLLLALTFILSGLFMFLWAKTAFDERTGFLMAIFYLFAPFHLVDLHFRVSPGDMLVYMFFPLILFGITSLFRKMKLNYFYLLSFATAGMISSHPISLVCFTFIGIYTIYTWKKNNYTTGKLLIVMSSIIVGLLLAAFYWLPVVAEAKYTLTALHHEEIEFQPINEYIFSPWRYGFLFQGHKGELSFMFGYVQMMLIFYGGYLVLGKKLKKHNKTDLLFYISCFLLLFLMLFSFTKPLWEILPLFRNLQFSYRIIILGVPLTAIISGLVLRHINNKTLSIFICIIAIGATILNWGHRRVIPEIDDNFLIHNLPYSTYYGEGGNPAAPRWVNEKKPWMKDIPKAHLEVRRGSATIAEIQRTSVTHHYVVNASTDVLLKENTYYFPGWIAKANGKTIPLSYTNPKYPGVMELSLPKGKTSLEFIFTHTPLRNFADGISVVTLLLMLIFCGKKVLRFH